MSDNPCKATIRGLPHIPSITEINVRSGPGTNFDILFKGMVGLADLEIQTVTSDDEEKNLGGKVYQWFQLAFPDGQTGWIRDDLLDIQGDCAGWGYNNDLPPGTFAFMLARNLDIPIVDPEVPQETIPALAVNIDRMKKAAFAVTAAFEGSGYASYNNYDAGIVSYGFIQFTLAAGSLFTVVDQYLSNSNSPTAHELRTYHAAIRNREPALRHAENLKRLLIQAANESQMQQAQQDVATVYYWDKVVDGYITHRGLKLPLAYALLFDMGVNFGTGHGFVRLAEEKLGVPLRSKPGENGITEEQLITKVAELRKISHDRQAERDNLPGLRVRGDFWVDRVNQGDWNFLGDADGNVTINTRKIQVVTP